MKKSGEAINVLRLLTSC